jgi:hypothetical protein
MQRFVVSREAPLQDETETDHTHRVGRFGAVARPVLVNAVAANSVYNISTIVLYSVAAALVIFKTCSLLTTVQ